MRFGDLEYVAASARAGSFSRAAQLLGLSASTISRRVSSLEDELGLSLFERTRIGVRLTQGGKVVLTHVRRALAEIDGIRSVGLDCGAAVTGRIRLGVRMPPIGEPLSGFLADWHAENPTVMVSIAECADRDIAAALVERRLDAALVPSFTLWPHAEAFPIYREQIVAVLPTAHPLTAHPALDWASLRNEIVLVQGWDESQEQREFFAALLGGGTRFDIHSASKQSIIALVAAGYGITLAAKSQAEVIFPGVVFRPVVEPNAWFRVDLAWMPETEDPAVGRFVAFMRDEAKSRHLL